MTKRAVLIGCNYPGSQAELHGCVNDVFAMKAMLTELYGFVEEDFTILIDTDDTYEQPTGKNIKLRLREAVAASQPGDILFLHFSGHGTQIPGDSEEEADMKDEAICPTDMNVILDDDLRGILKDLDDDVFLTFVSDCCHSGGMLDHAAIQISGPKDGASLPQMDLSDILSSFGMRELSGSAEKMEGFRNRSLPVGDLMAILSEKMGEDVELGNLRGALGSLFGADASSKVQMYLQVAAQIASIVQQQNAAKDGEEGSAVSIGCLASIAMVLFSLLGSSQGSAQGPALDITMPPPGGKPPTEEQLGEDRGVLITGCQAHETSADACPSGDKARAYGALSNALITVVKRHSAQNPQEPLAYRTLVYSIRDLLSKGGYSQNPCLEGSGRNADSNFVTGSL